MMKDMTQSADQILANLGLTAAELMGGSRKVRSPIDGRTLAELHDTPASEMAAILNRAEAAFKAWRMVPAPVGAS